MGWGGGGMAGGQGEIPLGVSLRANRRRDRDRDFGGVDKFSSAHYGPSLHPPSPEERPQSPATRIAGLQTASLASLAISSPSSSPVRIG